jgi:hypothetical protein
MMRRLAVCLVSLVLTAPAWAQEQDYQEQEGPPATGGSGTPQAQATDMTQMGPWTRKPTNEAKTRKEVEAFIKEEDANMKRRDLNASLARTDFPLFMATDDSKGVPSAQTYDRQQYAELMKPLYDQMPADSQIRHDLDVTVLSDSLVTFTDTYVWSHGGKKHEGRNAGLLVKQDGQWKWKAFFEAGWGDIPNAQGVGGSGTEGYEPPDMEKEK